MKIDWQDQRSYDYLKSLGTSELAWEFLRRNPAYQADYEANIRANAHDSEALTAFSDRWGLHFPDRSRTRGDRSTSNMESGNRPDDARA